METTKEIKQSSWDVLLPALVAVIVFALAACGGSGAGVDVQDPWGRPSPASADNAAFYMVLVSGSEGDTLTTATADACALTEIHETSMTDGQMSMAPVPGGIDVPADSTVMLEPGGYHIMCMGVTESLEAGDTVEVELEFSSGVSVTINAEIRGE